MASYLESQAHESMSVKVGRSSAWRNGGDASGLEGLVFELRGRAHKLAEEPVVT